VSADPRPTEAEVREAWVADREAESVWPVMRRLGCFRPDFCIDCNAAHWPDGNCPTVTSSEGVTRCAGRSAVAHEVTPMVDGRCPVCGEVDDYPIGDAGAQRVTAASVGQ
jgi:hypothetical protein